MPPHVPFECPERPIFKDYPDELWRSIPEAAQENIVSDDLAMKAYIRACEAAAEIHNED